MTPNEYLLALLESQTLSEDSQELKDLRARGDDVKNYLQRKLGKAAPSIRYAGSYIKKTLIRDSYDLDVTIYVPRDNKEAGETIAAIFETVRKALAEEYYVETKTSALRLKGLDNKDLDFHVDVVPGRYVDASESDVFLHRTDGNKERLLTNLDVHIDHVRDSGVTEAIRAMKIWRNRNGLSNFKTFVLELAVIKLLADKKTDDLASQITHVLTEFRDAIDAISVTDPANSNNDLSPIFNATVRSQVSQVAKSSLVEIDGGRWDAVFGPLPNNEEDRKEAVRRAGGGVSSKPVAPLTTRPWFLARPGDLAAMRTAVSERYSNLHAHPLEGRVLVVGTFPLRDGGREIDAYRIEVRLPNDYPRSLPTVVETGGRIPRRADHHVNETDGTLCLGVPAQLHMLYKSFGLPQFLDGPLREYLLGHSFFEVEGHWPGGEWPHGGEGIVEFFSEVFEVDDSTVALRLLETATRSEPKWRRPCPCGSARKLADCHGPAVERVRSEVPRDVLSASLSQLRR